jgi:integrase
MTKTTDDPIDTPFTGMHIPRSAIEELPPSTVPVPGMASPTVSPPDLYLARLSPGSRSTMESALRVIARLMSAGTHTFRELPWHEFGYADAVGLRTALIESGRAPTTVSKILSAWRGTIAECWRAGWITAEQRARACDVASVKAERIPAGRALTFEEVEAMIAACREDTDRPVAAARDIALVSVLFGCALRRSEAAGADIENLDLEQGSLTVVGKRSRVRVVYLQPETAGHVREWLELVDETAGPLFRSVDRTQIVLDRRLSSSAVGLIMSKRSVQAGIAPATPHDARRGSLTGMLDEGAQLDVVSDVAGHASVQTTMLYSRDRERRKIQAAAKLQVPA